MFAKRTSSQKPNDELYHEFKASFSQITGRSNSNGTPPQQQGLVSDALDVALNPRQYADQQAIKDHDPTPRGNSDPWNFSTGLTPSVLDPNSSSFNSFANQLPGYYTPTPGGTNTLFHPQAGDLHTPGILGLGTPLSMSMSDHALHARQQVPGGMHDFNPQMYQMHQNQFTNLNPFHMHQSETFPPQNFQHHPPMFERVDSGNTDSPMCNPNFDIEMHNQQSDTLFPNLHMGNSMAAPPLHTSLEKFRYHVTLNAPTAMIKHADEVPVTYLNKGQAYTLSVVDSAPQQSVVGQLKYRTFVRVSFEEESQRQRPGACWQLWKEGRGTNEAHQRGGRLQAVEYVESSQMNGGIDDPSRPKVELESASFDGFCVTWTPGANGLTECPISVRFNFLSTDFSHSKGVKGIPVRLCAKTELLLDSMSPTSPQQPAHEVCYCKVKLFRDHGAERKLSNDVAHVKKTIEKLSQQIQQAESGMRDVGKRKRSGSISKPNTSHGPGKVPKHRRTWSMSSNTSSGGKVTPEDDLQRKLVSMQDMFSSTRPASVLFLRGSEEDDADLHPVRLVGEPHDLTKVEPHDLTKVEPSDTAMWERQSTRAGSSMVSPTPSTQSLSSGGHGNAFQPQACFAPPSRMNSNEWGSNQSNIAPMDLQSANPQHLASPPEQAVKIQTRSPNNGTLSGWIESLGVDHSYQPPPERVIKPVACFYIQPRVAGKMPEDNLYRALYLTQRSCKDFVNAAATKCGIEPTQVIRIVRVSRKGLHVLVDDEAIREMPEGQDMTAEFSEMQSPAPKKPSREWDSGSTDIQVDGDLSSITNTPSFGYELKLLY